MSEDVDESNTGVVFLSPEDLDKAFRTIIHFQITPREEVAEGLRRGFIIHQMEPEFYELFLEKYLHLLYDDYDENFVVGELAISFRSREIANYLLSALEPEFLRMLLLLILTRQESPPLLILLLFCEKFDHINMAEIIDNLAELIDRRDASL